MKTSGMTRSFLFPERKIYINNKNNQGLEGGVGVIITFGGS